jgi:hypothetical protein
VTGYHSCDREVGLRMLTGKDHLRSSNNPWDWLGPGIYFWEHNPFRALQYGVACARNQQKFNGKITHPLVLATSIELGHCLDLTEPNSVNILKEAYKMLKRKLRLAGEKMPVNKGANRSLDCAVIRHLQESNKIDGLPPYDTVRSPFPEGKRIYKQANFTVGLHIEICVINSDKIVGYYLPQPVEKYNPWLNEDFPH